jgi:glycosyltransferase involved in cell wall biosynthesis
VVSPATDVRLLFHSHTVAVAPLTTGGDIRRAVLEPMAAGVAVVTSAQTCAQIEGRPGRDLRVADGPDDFVGNVVELLENRGLREELGAEGRRVVQANFSWEASAARFEAVLSAVGNGGAHRENGSSSQPMPATLGG